MLWREKRSTSNKKKTPKMQSTNASGKKSEDGLTLLQTGLFVKWDRSQLLLQIVENMLRTRFHTTAESGPCRHNGTCEIILRPLQSSGANFAASKVLLEQYLNMINESKPGFVLEKNPEVIDLVGEDDEVSLVVLDKNVNDTIPVIDLDTPARNAVQRNHPETVISCEGVESANTNRNVNSGSINIIEIDLLNESKSSCSQSQFENDVRKESNNQRRKRKFPFETEDVVEILDDDLIILEDSFSTPNSIIPNKKHANSDNNTSQSTSNLKVTVVGDSRNVSESISEEMDHLYDKTLTACSSRLVSSLNFSKSSKDLFANSNNAQNLESQNNNQLAGSKNSVSPFSTPSKKVSKKLTYKRPAHLIQPLINTTSNDVPKVKTDSVSNIYNPDAGVSEKRSGLRPIVIDGNNVAVSHGKGQFSLKGIQICVNYFEKRGHRQIKAFIPHYRINKNNFQDLHKMERQGTVVVTPSRKVEGKIVASYDDRYIVQYASEFGGIIVSTDNYRDLLGEDPSWKETIEKRLLMFTWVDDLLMFPQDPLGRKGPSLENFLKFPD